MRTEANQNETDTIPVDASIKRPGYMDRSLADVANPGRQDQCTCGFAVTKLHCGGAVQVHAPASMRWDKQP
ncbi:MAG TPA: hypothetical protein VKI41_08095 [Vicinamibacteria bacterium]|nr:hypothetical protein [Vicinamibacteria bacterium]